MDYDNVYCKSCTHTSFVFAWSFAMQATVAPGEGLLIVVLPAAASTLAIDILIPKLPTPQLQLHPRLQMDRHRYPFRRFRYDFDIVDQQHQSY